MIKIIEKATSELLEDHINGWIKDNNVKVNSVKISIERPQQYTWCYLAVIDNEIR